MAFITKTYELHSKKIKKGLNIVIISDLHGNQHGLDNIAVSDKIDKIKPDIIFILGDMISRHRSRYIATIRLFETISKYDCYFINGNHEEKIRETSPLLYKSYINSLKNLKIRVLHNKSIYLEKYNVLINGLDLPLDSYVKLRKYDYSFIKHKNIFPSLDFKSYNILLSHNPYVIESMDFDYDLVLSGHMHGGAIRIPALGGLLSPNLLCFPKYDRGYFRLGKTSLIVSSGMGDHFPMFRINNPMWLVNVKIY